MSCNFAAERQSRPQCVFHDGAVQSRQNARHSGTAETGHVSLLHVCICYCYACVIPDLFSLIFLQETHIDIRYVFVIIAQLFAHFFVNIRRAVQGLSRLCRVAERFGRHEHLPLIELSGAAAQR